MAANTTVFYPSTDFGANSTYLHYRVADGTWTTVPGVKMTAACDGWVSYTIKDAKEQPVEFVVTNGSGQWDNNGGQNYKASSATIVLKDGQLGSVSPCVASVEKTPITVYYKPTAAWKTVKMSYTIGTKTTNNVTMKSVCDGWYNATIPDTGGKNVKTAFTTTGMPTAGPTARATATGVTATRSPSPAANP